MTPTERRFQLLHFLYRRGAAVQHWFSMRIRPAGVAAMLIVSLASFMSIGQPRNSVFQIFCFSLAMVLAALFWVVFRRSSLSASFRLPRHATAGEPLQYSVLLTNNGKSLLKSVILFQSPPDPRPDLREFASTAEPGESERNPFDRTMAFYRWQWLSNRKRSFESNPQSEPFSLNPGVRKRVALSVTPLKRGVIAMENLRALLPDPLGFFQKSRTINSTPSRLIVLPKRYRLPDLRMPGSAHFRIGGEETGNTVGSSGEFVGLRDYRPGDPLRLIHWKSWAHTGRPVVKELEDTYYPRYALVLDTFPGSPDGQVFEEMVSVAASFIVGFDRSEALLDLMFIADKAHTVTAGRGMDRVDKLLEVLAGVQIEAETDFETLALTVARHRDTVTSCLVILNGWDESRKSFLKSMLSSGVPCVPLVVGKDASPEGLIGHWLKTDSIAADLLRLPADLRAPD